jgi:hypothetical protein
MAILAEHHHNGTLGDTATAAGEGYDGSAGTATYVAGGVSGGVSVRYPSGTVHHRDDVTAAYIMFAFTPGAVTGSTTILRTATTGDTSLSSIRILSTGALTIWSGLSPQVDTTATGVIVAGTTYYASMFTGSSTQELRLYSAAGTLLDTLTGAAVAGTAGRYYVGHGHGGASTDGTDIDEVLMADGWLAPTTNIVATPPTAVLTLTTFAPSIVLNTIIVPSTTTLTLTTLTPVVAVSDNKTVVPGATSLALSTFAPSVTVSDNKSVTPNTASLTLTAFAPTVAVSDNRIVTPDTASLTLTAFEPTITVSDNTVVTPSTAGLVLTTFAPTVSVGSNVEVTPSTAALILTGYAPTVRVSVDPRNYYIDSDGNVYWVINQSLGLVERI